MSNNNRLRELRIAAGMVQGALAVKAGVSPGTIGNIERYNYLPSASVRQRIAKALRCRLTDIWPADVEAAVA